eukprot:scaffold4925_cov16-Tisochrysis_lutea.AAC.2
MASACWRRACLAACNAGKSDVPFLPMPDMQGALSNAWLGQGLQEAPSIAAISLYKYDGIMQ